MASIFLEGWSQIQASQRPTRSILKLNWSSVSLNVSNAALLRNASALKLCRTVTHPPFIPLQPLILHTSRCSVHSAAFNPLSNIPLLRSTFHYRSLTVLPLDTACLPFQVRLFPYGTVYYVPSNPESMTYWWSCLCDSCPFLYVCSGFLHLQSQFSCYFWNQTNRISPFSSGFLDQAFTHDIFHTCPNSIRKLVQKGGQSPATTFIQKWLDRV